MAKKTTISFSITGTTLAGNEKTVQFDVTDVKKDLKATALSKVYSSFRYTDDIQNVINETFEQAFPKPAKELTEKQKAAIIKKDANDHSKDVSFKLSLCRKMIATINGSKESNGKRWAILRDIFKDVKRDGEELSNKQIEKMIIKMMNDLGYSEQLLALFK